MKRSYYLTQVGVLLLWLLTFSVQAAQQATDDTVKQAYDNWTAAINSAQGKVNTILALYSEDAILLPTLSPNLHYKQKNHFAPYFEKLTTLPSFAVNTKKMVTQVYGDMAIASGTYTFSYNDEIGEKVELPSRFSFVYQKQGKDWLIVNHHSSMLPPAIE